MGNNTKTHMIDINGPVILTDVMYINHVLVNAV